MPSAELLIELGAVLLGLAVLGRLSGRFGYSPVPLYLISGLAFGEGGLLPLGPTEDFIEVGAEIGAVLLLFALGLEYSARELAATLRSSSRTGLVDAALNFTPGAVTGLLLGWDTKAALLLGGITWVTSSGVVAKLLYDMGRIGNRETPAILGVLVIEDLAMAAYLPLMASLLSQGDAESVARVHPPGPRRGRRRRLDRPPVRVGHQPGGVQPVGRGAPPVRPRPDPPGGGLAEAVHISAPVGAFFVGITLSGRAADGARALLSPLRDLFAAVFFVFFGLSVDPSDLVERGLRRRRPRGRHGRHQDRHGLVRRRPARRRPRRTPPRRAHARGPWRVLGRAGHAGRERGHRSLTWARSPPLMCW